MDEMGIGEEQYSLITNARSLVSVASLDVPIGEDDDTLFSDIVPNGETPVEDQVENAMCYDLLKKVIDEKLDFRQKKILYMRDGIIDEECGTDGKFYTLAEIGQEFGVTRERIRQIETRTHKSLDHDAKVKQIYSSLYGELPKIVRLPKQVTTFDDLMTQANAELKLGPRPARPTYTLVDDLNFINHSTYTVYSTPTKSEYQKSKSKTR